MQSRRGQGALEYLLLIGGAVAVAAIVIVLIMGMAPRIGNVAEGSIADWENAVGGGGGGVVAACTCTDPVGAIGETVGCDTFGLPGSTATCKEAGGICTWNMSGCS